MEHDLQKVFLARGYHTGKSSLKSDDQRIYQKCIWEDNTKKYYINFFEWDWRKYPAYVGKPITYSSEVHYDARGVEGFSCSHRHEVTCEADIAFLEAFYEDVYQKMGALPYSEEE